MNDAPARTSRASWLLFPVFFLSGFAALLYQMIWQRILTFFGGADVYSVTLIVAAFMAGLGFGSLAGGRLADRLSLRGRLRAFALAELAVAAFAFVSVPLFYDGLYLRVGPHPLPGALVGLVLFVVLLWPTFFMGLSLPLLAATLGSGGSAPEAWIGRLYGLNTLGAACGSLLTVWGLVRAFGFGPCVTLGALLNLICAVAALVLAKIVTDSPTPIATIGSAQTPTAPQTFGWRTWLAIYALSGFIALSLEIVWFRVLGVILKSNSFTFATLLAIYLTGIGVGALIGARWARGSTAPARRFLVLQALVPAYAGLSLALFVAGVGVLPGTHGLAAHLNDYQPVDIERALHSTGHTLLRFGRVAPHVLREARDFLTLYGLVPLFLIGPPTLFMGMSFPYLQKAAQTDPAVVGRRVGLLQAANILGSTLGAALTGLFLLQTLSTAWTLRLLEIAGSVFLSLLVYARGRRFSGHLLAVAAGIGVACLSPGPASLWATLHGALPQDLIVAEDASGLAVLKQRTKDGAPMTVVVANGAGQSTLPYGRTHGGVHTLLGAFPVLLHPQPREVAIIGLGSGDTVFAASGRPETASVDCVEIVAPQLATLRSLASRHVYPALDVLFQDARVRYTLGDGRAFLMRGVRRYDVIEADALLPNAAFAGSLYSRDYFELLRGRLKPGGFAVSWCPTPRTRDSFVAAFPHVLLLGEVLVGSETPIAFEREHVRARLDEPFTHDHYQRGGVDIARLVGDFMAHEALSYGPSIDRSLLLDVNRDLFPKDEYMVPRDAKAKDATARSARIPSK